MTREAKVRDIREHPERHRHRDLNELARCCADGDAIDIGLMDEHEKVATRRNGGRACDVTEGPCSCGAWH